MSTQTQSISLFQKISSEDFSVILDLILTYRLNKRTFFFFLNLSEWMQNCVVGFSNGHVIFTGGSSILYIYAQKLCYGKG